MGTHYPREILSSDYDNGTITGNRERLEETLIGRRIVTAAIGGAKIDRPEWDWLNDEVGGRDYGDRSQLSRSTPKSSADGD